MKVDTKETIGNKIRRYSLRLNYLEKVDGRQKKLKSSLYTVAFYLKPQEKTTKTNQPNPTYPYKENNYIFLYFFEQEIRKLSLPGFLQSMTVPLV